MPRIVLLASLALACSGCAPAPAPVAIVPAAVVSGATVTVSPGNPACRDYTAQVIIDGEAKKVVGHACQLPDGSWRVAEGTPEQPSRIVFIYPGPAYPDYVYAPWFWGPPIGLSFGALVFVDHRHQLRHVDRFHHFDHFHRFDGAHRFDETHNFGDFHRLGGFGGFRHFGFNSFHGSFAHGGWGGMAHGGMGHH